MYPVGLPVYKSINLILANKSNLISFYPRCKSLSVGKVLENTGIEIASRMARKSSTSSAPLCIWAPESWTHMEILVFGSDWKMFTCCWLSMKFSLVPCVTIPCKYTWYEYWERMAFESWKCWASMQVPGMDSGQESTWCRWIWRIWFDLICNCNSFGIPW